MVLPKIKMDSPTSNKYHQNDLPEAHLLGSLNSEREPTNAVLVVTRTFHHHFIVAHSQLQEEKHFRILLLGLMPMPASALVHLMGVLPSLSLPF